MTATIVVEAPADTIRSRPTLTTFSWEGQATSVEVSGEWDDWDVRTDLTEAGGEWTVSLALDQGMYCYKLIVDDNWIFDPSEPYRGYCGGFENSVVRVDDTSKPMFTHSIENSLLTVLWHAGTDGGAPESTPFALATGLWDEETWTWTLDLSTLPEGKNTLHITGEDVDGNQAEDLLLPFWNGPQADFIWEDALIYMVMTDRFVNGDGTNDPLSTNAAQGADWMGGDLTGVTQMIQSGYFANLGVNALWLTPFNAAADGTELAADEQNPVSAYHGYWPVAAREVDSRLGTEAELEALVEAAHDAGIRVLGDFVINHVHEDHPYYTDNPEWFNEGCLCGEENCGWTEHRLDCMFRPYMPDVNWRVREASEQLISDVMWWMETFDLDGGRIDAVKHVEDLAITNLAVRINERFETAGTDYFLKGETAMGWSGHTLEENAEEYGTINNYIGPNALDGQADFVLYHAVVDNVFTSGNMDYQHLDYWTARSQDQYVDGATMAPFVSSHDVSRFASRADSGTDDAWNQWEEDGLPGQPGTDGPYQAALQAYTWLLTTPGAGVIYQGDEYGDYGGADPDNRHVLRTDSNLNARESSLMANISAIGQLRQDSEALRQGTYASLSNGTDTIAWSMTTESDQAVIAMNRGSTSAEFDLELDWVAYDALNDIPMDPEHRFTLEPHSVAIFLEADALPFNQTNEPDGHCLTVDNLTVNETLFITLDLVNICDKEIHYPGVNATADNPLVSGFSGMVEWYYLIFAETSYPHSWQLILNESIPNGTEITLTFEAWTLNCGEVDNWHDCPNSVLQHTFTVGSSDPPVDPPEENETLAMDYWAHTELGRPGHLNVTLEAQSMDPDVPITIEYRVRHDLVIDDEPHMTNLGGEDIPMLSGQTTFNQTFEVAIDNGAGSYCVRIYLRLPDGDWIRPSQNHPGALSCTGVPESHWDNMTESEPATPIDGCTDSDATNFDNLAEVDDGTCVYPEPEPQTGPQDTIEDDQSSSGSGNSQSSGGMTTGQLIKVALGVLTLIAGAFLVTLMVRVRNQDDEPKFE
jgi:glycosidase